MTKNLSSEGSSRSATPGETPSKRPSALSTISTSLWIFPCLFNTSPNAPRPGSTFSTSQVTSPLSQVLASLPVTSSVPRAGCSTTSTGSGGPAEVIAQALAGGTSEASCSLFAPNPPGSREGTSLDRDILVDGRVDGTVLQGHVGFRAVQVLDLEGHARGDVGVDQAARRFRVHPFHLAALNPKDLVTVREFGPPCR